MNGRTSCWADAESDLTSGVGTVIVDQPCAGWNDADIWWIRESVRTAAANNGVTLPPEPTEMPDPAEFEARMNAPEFDHWCQARYFNESNGVARLLHSTHWRRDLRKARKRIDGLLRLFPGLETINTYTGMVNLAAAMPERKTGQIHD